MKKAVFGVLMLIVAFSFFAVGAFGAESESDDINKIWEDFKEISPDGSIGESYEDILGDAGVSSIFEKIADAIGAGASEAVSLFILLLGVATLIAVAESGGMLDGALSRHTAVGVSIISSILIFGRIAPICLEVRESLESLSSVFGSIIPIMTGILGAGGNVNSAAAQALNMNITLGALSYTASEILIPLVFALFSLALVSGMGSGAVASVAKGVKGIFSWLMGIVGAVVIGAVSMQSVIAGAKDSAYLRAAKYAASDIIPVVGSTVSGALATLAGGLSYLKSAVGVSSVVMIIGVALGPLIRLLLCRFAFSLSISFLDFMSASSGSRTFSAFRSALDTLISVYALATVIYLAEIIVFMRSGGAAFG